MSAEPQQVELLRLTTAGSVDDGKSTLIGRLLYEADALCEDHVAAARQGSKQDLGGEIDFSLFTDGLVAEREQGITIDVAYRYFSTPKRRFIIADTPGHVQYTRNMVTGASNADLAILLVDAKLGMTTQSKRHASIASLLGIPHVIVAINKMDLVDWSAERFEEIRREYGAFARKLAVKHLSFIPVSALTGDNVVAASPQMPWYEGGTLLHQLENAYIGSDRNYIDLRFPIQLVLRPDPSYRGYAGIVESGTIKKGDDVVVLPSRKTSKVKAVEFAGEELERAEPQQSVTVTLEDELDISRGDVLVHAKNLSAVVRELDAVLIWMDETPFSPNTPYIIRHTTNTVRGQFTELQYAIDPDTLHRSEAEVLELNEIGRVVLKLYRPLVCDDYGRNRRTGSFIVINPNTNATVGAGLIIERGRGEPGFGGKLRRAPASLNIVATSGQITAEDRARILGHRSFTLWLTGLSGAGKSTIAYAVESALADRGHLCYVLDGDNLRHGLTNDLAFSDLDRRENIRRVAEVASLFNDAGVVVLSSFISPFREDRQRARQIVGPERFLEVFVDTPLETCEERDPKGLYAKARAGEIPDFTGISSPYEAPENPDLHVHSGESTPEAIALEVVTTLEQRGLLTHV